MLELLKEFVEFLKERKKWWLIPVFIVIAVSAVLIVLSETTVAPLIYTLF